MLTGVPLAQLADETWEVLRTYEQVASDLKARRNGVEEEASDDGYATLLQHADRYGG